MALAISATNTEVRKPVNVVYQENLLRNARPLAPYFLGTQRGTIQENAGTATVVWRRFPTDADPAADSGGAIAPTATALTELTGDAAYGQGRTEDTVGTTDVTATVAKYGQYYIINEEVEVLNPNNTMRGISATLGISAGRSLNRVMRNVWEDNVTLIQAGGAASDGVNTSAITQGSIRSAIQTLTNNSAMPFTPMSDGSTTIGSSPLLPAYWLICHPYVASDVALLSGFTSAEKYTSHVDTVPGEFGAIGDAGAVVRCVQTPEAVTDAASGGTVGSTGLNGTSGVDLHTSVIFGQEAAGSVGLGQQHTDGIYRAGDDLGVIEMMSGQRQVSPADPYAELTVLSWKAWFAGAILNANWCRGVRSGATSISA
jgi:N4-gp56 family major capsid protein